MLLAWLRVWNADSCEECLVWLSLCIGLFSLLHKGLWMDRLKQNKWVWELLFFLLVLCLCVWSSCIGPERLWSDTVSLPESRLWFVTTFGSSVLYVTLLLTDVNIHFVKVCYAQCYVLNDPAWKRCTPEATNLISTCATEIGAHFLKKKHSGRMCNSCTKAQAL